MFGEIDIMFVCALADTKSVAPGPARPGPAVHDQQRARARYT
jgi:hypothetical protein